MSAEEVESYKFQLEQVQVALEADPENEELLKLQNDLKELINMFESALASNTNESKPKRKAEEKKEDMASETTALKTHEFSVDQEVMARWSGDGQFYKATITAIGGADQVFSVKFKGYNDTEFVKAEDIKAIQDKKRTGIFENVEPSKKNKTNKNSNHNQPVESSNTAPKKKKTKTVEFENKKNAWLNFATGSKKKASQAINKKSIFKTPDNPDGKGNAKKPKSI